MRMKLKTLVSAFPGGHWFLGSQLMFLLSLCLALASHEIWAAAPITPSGLNTQVSPPVTLGNGQTQYNITGGIRPGGGTNLFHSFGNFNVPTNNIANFLNSGSIGLNGAVLPPNLPTANILGRINGGNPSSIFGMIQTNGPGGFPNANLFLMNPNGFLFGPTATINVGGMVSFTTADYLRLTDNTRFNAVAGPADLVLSAAPVAAFGFLGNNPTAIAIQGSTLKVADGQSLSLVGGNQGFIATDPDTGHPIPVPGGITMTGSKLLAPGGQINIASVAGPGEISAVDLMPTSGMAMGSINLSQGTLVDVSADAAGTVRIRGGQFLMDQSTISADTVNSNGASLAIDINVIGDMSISSTNIPALTAKTGGSGNAGEIRVASGNFTAQISPTDPSFALIDTHTSGTGRAGKITIDTGTLDARTDNGGYLIDTGTGAAGNGNDVFITAKTVTLNDMNINTGDFRAIFSTPQNFNATGSGGNISITADTIHTDFAVLVTQAFQGQAGDITLTAHDIAMNGSLIGAVGLFGSGAVTVKANRFTMTNNTQIETETAFVPGRDIVITTDVLEMTNGSIIRTQTSGPEPAGNILVTATDHITLSDPPLAARPSGFYSNSYGVPDVPLDTLGGNAGSIVLTTPSLTMLGGARIDTTTQTSGRGGDVTINTTGSVSISGELTFPPLEDVFTLGSATAGGIFTRTIGGFCSSVCGNAGHITINAGALAVGNGSLIDSGTSSTGRGGNITIHAKDTISLSGTLNDGSPAGIFSRSFGTDQQSGSGGNIELNTAALQITNGAQISASTLGTGSAGIVSVEGTASPAESVAIDGQGSGIFTTTSGTGTGGNITVDAKAVTMTTGASITASSTGPGNTGNIQINAGNQFNMTNSTVTTEANQSGGGIIKITTNPNGTVQLTDSTISASVLDGNGGGGSVNIDPQSVVLINSQILAQAIQGPGGNINITTNLLLPDSTSVISASSQFGQQGTVIIQSPISPASGKIVPLGQKPLLATSLLSQRCAAIAGGSISSFSLAGRDSLPAEPGGWVSTPLALSISASEDGTVSEADRVMEDETPLLSLRKIAPPGFLTQAFAVDSSDCS